MANVTNFTVTFLYTQTETFSLAEQVRCSSQGLATEISQFGYPFFAVENKYSDFGIGGNKCTGRTRLGRKYSSVPTKFAAPPPSFRIKKSSP